MHGHLARLEVRFRGRCAINAPVDVPCCRRRADPEEFLPRMGLFFLLVEPFAFLLTFGFFFFLFLSALCILRYTRPRAPAKQPRAPSQSSQTRPPGTVPASLHVSLFHYSFSSRCCRSATRAPAFASTRGRSSATASGDAADMPSRAVPAVVRLRSTAPAALVRDAAPESSIRACALMPRPSSRPLLGRVPSSRSFRRCSVHGAPARLRQQPRVRFAAGRPDPYVLDHAWRSRRARSFDVCPSSVSPAARRPRGCSSTASARSRAELASCDASRVSEARLHGISRVPAHSPARCSRSHRREAVLRCDKGDQRRRQLDQPTAVVFEHARTDD